MHYTHLFNLRYSENTFPHLQQNSLSIMQILKPVLWGEL